MQLSLTLFPELDGLDGLIEATMPAFAIWLFALAIVLSAIVIHQCVDRIRHRSPVDRLLRRRFG